jgi:DNA-binding NarL/FixJ family response regulator
MGGLPADVNGTGTIVLLVDDLMFASRIREAAKGKGVAVASARTAAQVVDACKAGAKTVIADLDSPRLNALESIAAVAGDPALAGVHLVGFFSHVETETARAARAAGCRTVLPRSAFVRELPALIG